ncbi:MAG: energy-coupling factor ABC transporter ATP-binding protein [Microbacteriaceae bacterium]|nr:energy-coupling factor ABC transporter ATP-binding protein [Microbacteriaceae bacterium]
MRPARVEARGWGWRHTGRLRWALDGLDLVIEPGERVLLLGPSGAGKSTLLAALAGVVGGEEEGEQHGSLGLDGRPAAAARGRAGLVLQDPDAQAVLARVGDDVAFGCENLGVPRAEIWPRVAEALDAVGLDVPLAHPTARLSGGQRQRLAIAGVLAMRPGLLLLDEPTANLDPEGVAEVRAAVGRALERTGATLVVVEHRVSTWVDLVDRVVVLDHDGRLLADGAPDAVFAQQRAALETAGVWLPDAALPLFDGELGSAAARSEPVLTAAGLAVGRERRGEPVRAGLSFDIPAGASTVITGRNGVGKSTLALTLGGLLAPLGGRVEASPALARGLVPEPHRWRSTQLLTRIGTVFQEPEHTLVARTVRDEIGVGLRALRASRAEADARIDELLDRLHLGHLAHANPFTLSGGEKRRLSVAGVLAARPPVLVLDEPTFGQDRATWLELVRLLRELVAGGSALVSVSHDADFVRAFGDRVLRLDEAGLHIAAEVAA